MAVYHVLKDGTRLTDISGHVVKLSDSEDTYSVMTRISERVAKANKKEEQ